MSLISKILPSLLSFSVRTDIAVVGQNPEMADMDSPRGEILGEAHYMVAEAPNGRRFAHTQVAYTWRHLVLTTQGAPIDDPDDLFTWFVDSGALTPDRLAAQAERLNRARPTLSDDFWTEIEPAYGSEIYQRDGWELLNLEREKQEDASGW